MMLFARCGSTAARTGKSATFVRTGLALVLLASTVLAAPARAEITGNWTPNGSTSATTSVLGINFTMSGNSEGAYSSAAFGAGNYWTNPYSGTVPGGASVAMTVPATSVALTYSFTFSEPVDNPVLHVERVGGVVGGLSTTSGWTLASSVSQGGSVAMQRLSGNAQFVVNGNLFGRSTGVTASGTECTTGTTGTACGSIRFNGTGITSLTFSVSSYGALGADGIEFRWSLAGSTVTVRKQSANGTGSFAFTRGGALGAGTFSLDTSVANPAVSATFPVADHSQAITIGETQVPASFTLAGASCVDQGGAAVTSTLVGGALSIASASYGANQAITCTFNNTLNAELSVTKTNTPAQGDTDQPADQVVSGAPTTYSIVVRNNGPGAAAGAVLRDPVPAGVTCSTVSCGAASGGAACPPPASVTIAALQSAAGLSLPTLPAAGSMTFTLQCSVP